MLETTTSLRTALRVMGFGGRTEGIRPRALLYMLLLYFLTYKAVLSAAHRWSDMQARSLALDDLSAFHFVIIFTLDVATNRKKFMVLLRIAEDELHVYAKRSPERSAELVRTHEDAELLLHRALKLVMLIFIVNLAVVPFLLSVHSLITSDSVDVLSLPLPSEYWFEGQRPTLLYFSIIFFLEVVCYTGTLGTAYVGIGACYTTIQHIITEYKLLCIALEELDFVLSSAGQWNSRAKQAAVGSTPDYAAIEEEIRWYLKRIVDHHSFILRRMLVLNKTIATLATGLNQTLSFGICMFLYCAVEAEEMIMKIKYYLQFVSTVCILYQLTNVGQEILNEWDNVRRALTKLNWIDNPKWCRSSLLIMMTISNRPVMVKPFGVYIINRIQFATVMNASYSYYNFMLTMKRSAH